MSVESRLTDLEESIRLLRDANRLQGRRVSATAPTDGNLLRWNATTKKWEPTLASEVKSVYKATVSDSSSRVTVITPTSGKKVRIIAVGLMSASGTGTDFSVYFGTGAAIGTTPANAITQRWIDIDTTPSEATVWSGVDGPVGAVDAVVSLRTGSDITTNGTIVVQYREE